MKKNIYVSPKMEMMDIDMKCDILDVSTNLDKNEPEWGESGSGMEIDSKEREDWGGLW